MEQVATKEGLRHEGIYPDTQFVDRQRIEIQADRLIEKRRQMPNVEVKRQERVDNARTALMEALTASGHLSQVEITGTLDEINAQVLNRLLNGWDDSLPPHEKQRRYAELCNELVIQEVHGLIAQGQLPPDMAVFEISDYPQGLDVFTAKSLGYGYRNNKGMVRSTHLRHNGGGQYSRLIEQPSRANGTQASTFNFFSSAGIEVASERPADIAVLEKPCLYRLKDYRDGVVDVMRLLDKHSGSGVLYGDIGERARSHTPYEKLREESARREAEIECYIDDLADFETQLDGMVGRNEISYKERMNLFGGEVRRILSAICTKAPEYAEDTFGKAAAPHFYEAAIMTASGNIQGAEALLTETEHLQETITFCGVSISVEEAQEKGLKVNSYQQLLEKGMDSWKWKNGVCIVKECPSRPKKVEVGPCSVCKNCQHIFDDGKQPKNVYGSVWQRSGSENKKAPKESDWQRIKRQDEQSRTIQKQANELRIAKQQEQARLARQEELRLRELGEAA